MADLKQTPLYQQHKALDAKIVDFGGWALPVNYGSQIEEHIAVRSDCGMFDVSHMTVSDVTGPQTLAFLRHLLANDIDKVSQKPGKAIYSCMLNAEGGVIDDLIAYYINDEHCRLVTNAGTNAKDMAWMHAQIAPYQAQLEERPDLALIALQGPNALKIGTKLFAGYSQQAGKTVADLSRFQGAFVALGEVKTAEQNAFVGRTGYTGEDGFEFIIGADLAQQLWQQLADQGVSACGLGARDTLRLEAGMSLYGNDLDEQHTPIESGLKWSISDTTERSFIGQASLAEPRYKMIGLILKDRGVLRSHQKIHHAGDEIGEITSGTFSPTLQQSIAMARVNINVKLAIGDEVEIAIRNKKLAAVVAKYPFLKNGEPTNTK